MASWRLAHRVFRSDPIRGRAMVLEVSPANVKAFALYDRLGFRVKANTTLRLLAANDLDT